MYKRRTKIKKKNHFWYKLQWGGNSARILLLSSANKAVFSVESYAHHSEIALSEKNTNILVTSAYVHLMTAVMIASKRLAV